MIAGVAVDKLLELAWVSLVASVALSAAFSTCVLSITRASERRRAGHDARATAYAALAVGAAAAVAAGVVGAVAIIISG